MVGKHQAIFIKWKMVSLVMSTSQWVLGQRILGFYNHRLLIISSVFYHDWNIYVLCNIIILFGATVCLYKDKYSTQVLYIWL